MKVFNILGINESVKSRKKIYQLLLFFKLIKKRNPVTQRQLYRFLQQIVTSTKVLEEVKVIDKRVHFKPIKGVVITKMDSG